MIESANFKRIYHLLLLEQKRHQMLEARMNERLSVLPKGSPSVRRVKLADGDEELYLYLNQREKNKPYPQSRYHAAIRSERGRHTLALLDEKASIKGALTCLKSQRVRIEKMINAMEYLLDLHAKALKTRGAHINAAHAKVGRSWVE